MSTRPSAARLLAEAWEAFSTPLRDGSGVDDARYSGLCDALRVCAREWANGDVVPKLAANIFIDLFSATESCASLYDDNTGAKIREVADVIADLARQCVMVEG